MRKLSIQEQAARVMAFVRDKAPEAVLYHAVMYKFDISATKARNLCKVAASISDVYVFDKGAIRYTGDPETFNSGHKTLEEAFKDDEATEDSVQYSESEVQQIYNILNAVPASLEDKGSLKMPKSLKKEIKPNDIPH